MTLDPKRLAYGRDVQLRAREVRYWLGEHQTWRVTWP